jgi:hypothetical protein
MFYSSFIIDYEIWLLLIFPLTGIIIIVSYIILTKKTFDQEKLKTKSMHSPILDYIVKTRYNLKSCKIYDSNNDLIYRLLRTSLKEYKVINAFTRQELFSYKKIDYNKYQLYRKNVFYGTIDFEDINKTSYLNSSDGKYSLKVNGLSCDDFYTICDPNNVDVAFIHVFPNNYELNVVYDEQLELLICLSFIIIKYKRELVLMNAIS